MDCRKKGRKEKVPLHFLYFGCQILFYFFLIVWSYFLFLTANNWAIYTEPVSRLLLCYLNIFLEITLRKLPSIEDCNLAVPVFAYWKLSYEHDFVFLTIYSCSGSDLVKMWGVERGVVCLFYRKGQGLEGTFNSISRPTVGWTADCNFPG